MTVTPNKNYRHTIKLSVSWTLFNKDETTTSHNHNTTVTEEFAIVEENMRLSSAELVQRLRLLFRSAGGGWLELWLAGRFNCVIHHHFRYSA